MPGPANVYRITPHVLLVRMGPTQVNTPRAGASAGSRPRWGALEGGASVRA